MKSVIGWFQSAPPGAITLLTATMGAVVAIVVSVLTQWILGRRAKTELLTSKLEELYLLLNQAAFENVDRYEKLVVHLFGIRQQSDPIPLHRSMYSHDIHKKIVMYIRLYFPRLAPAHIRMFQSNKEIADILFRVSTAEKPRESEVKTAFTLYSDCLRNLEDEIIRNRATLVKEAVLPRRYKVSNLHVPMPSSATID